MTGTVAAIAPVFLVIVLGAALRRTRVMADTAWPPLERLVYVVLFPALLFRELATSAFPGGPALRLAVVLLCTQLLMAGAASLLRRGLALPGPTYTSLFQGLVRWNSYVALALAGPLLGERAVPLLAVAIAVMVPAANVLSVLALHRHGEGRPGAPVSLARALSTNPLILACVAGIVWNGLGLPLPGVAAGALGMLGGATLALGLLTVGAGLELDPAGVRPTVLLLAVIMKLLVKPAVAAGLGGLAGLDATTLAVAVLVTALPSASSAYILARLLGGDAPTMAAILTVQTAAAAFTLPVVLSLV